MVERIAELVREKRIEGISDLRDESDRDGMRVVIELKRDADAPTWCSTSSTASRRCRSIVRRQHGGAQRRPAAGDEPARTCSRPSSPSARRWSSRRTKFLLNKARDRAHVLVGLAIAVANIDEVIQLIRASKDASRGARSG